MSGTPSTYSLRKKNTSSVNALDHEDEGRKNGRQYMQNSEAQTKKSTPQQVEESRGLRAGKSQLDNEHMSPKKLGRPRRQLRGQARRQQQALHRGQRLSEEARLRTDAAAPDSLITLATSPVARSSKRSNDSSARSPSRQRLATPSRAGSSSLDLEADEGIAFALEYLTSPTADALFTSQDGRTPNVETHLRMAVSPHPLSIMETRQQTTDEARRAGKNVAQQHRIETLQCESQPDVDAHIGMETRWSDSLAEVERLLQLAQAPISSLMETSHLIETDMMIVRSEREGILAEKRAFQADCERLSKANKQLRSDTNDKDARIYELQESRNALSGTVERLMLDKSHLEMKLRNLQEGMKAIRRATLDVSNSDD